MTNLTGKSSTSLPGAPSGPYKAVDDRWRIGDYGQTVLHGNRILLSVGAHYSSLAQDELAEVVRQHNSRAVVAALDDAVGRYLDAGGTGHRTGDEGCGCDQCDLVQAIRVAWEDLP